jgi:acetyl-CoA C-acetyltransferase
MQIAHSLMRSPPHGRKGKAVTTPQVFVEGVSMEISFSDARRSLTDLIFDTVRGAVDDSGVPMTAIDSVVISAHDLVDGRSLTSMVTAPAAGAYLRDEVRFSDDGAVALAAAVTKLESGEGRRSIVAAWGRASEHRPLEFSRALFEPFMTRPLGLDELVFSAMRAQLYLCAASTRGAREAASVRRAERARANPRGLRQGGFRSEPYYPLHVDDLPLWADVAVALILSTDPSSVRVAGIGQASEPYAFGDRDVRGLAGLRSATHRAAADAKLALDAMDVYEIDGLTLIDEAMGLEAVEATTPGSGLALLADDPRCNPSGGGAAGYCPPAMGLARVAEAVFQLRGTAGPHQLDTVRHALATGSSTVAGQTHTAVVLAAA